MAPSTRARTRALPDIAPAVLEPEVLPESPYSEVDPYAEILRIRDELGDRGAEARVVLMRRLSSGAMAHVGEISAQDFTMGRVIKEWGGGHYEAAFYHGRAKLGAAIVFDVDPSIPTRIPEAVTGPRLPDVTAVSTAGAPIADPRLGQLEQALSRTGDLLQQLVVQLASNKPQETFGAREATELAIRLAELMKPNGAPAPAFDPAVIVDLIRSGIDLGRSSEGGENSMWPVIERFAGPVTDVLKSALEREKRVSPLSDTPVAANGHATRPAVSSAPQMPALPPSAPAWMVHLRPQIPTLLAWARAGKDPALYAEVILDNLDPGARMELMAKVGEPGFVDQALASLPMFAPYSAWATAVLTNIKELLTEDVVSGTTDVDDDQTD